MKAERLRAGDEDLHRTAVLLVKSVTLVTMPLLNYEQMIFHSHPDRFGTALAESSTVGRSQGDCEIDFDILLWTVWGFVWTGVFAGRARIQEVPLCCERTS